MFVRAMAAAGFRKSGKSKARSSNQIWSPNSGQVTEDGSQSPTAVFVSEHDQQPLACNLTLPQLRNDQTGMQTLPASSPLDQPQGGSDQYQPPGNNPTPLATGASDQYQPTANDQTSLARDGPLSLPPSLTPPVSRNDDTQRQDAYGDEDPPMPDAPSVHDIATPRRQIGCRCRK